LPKTRPLCFVCLLFLVLRAILFMIDGGSAGAKIPASSIFYQEKEQTVTIEGRVFQKSVTSNVQILYLKNNSVYDSKLMIYDENFTNIPLGKTVKLRGRLGFFEHAKNSGNFDQATYYFTRNIYGYIWLEKVVEISGDTNVLSEWSYNLKQKWETMLISEMGEENGSVLSAMLLGEKGEMNLETKELYQKTGIGHVLAISGLHVSFIGYGIYQILRKLKLPYSVAGMVSILVLLLYTLMIGMSISVFRALVMLVLKIIADMTGRVYDMMTAWSLAGALTILYQPLYLSDGGFYLSYGAIAGLLFVAPVLKKRNAGLAVNLVLFPILLWFYYEFSPYSILLNIFVIPLMSIIMGCGMAGSFAGLLFGRTLGLNFGICNLILNLYKWISKFTLQLPFARLVVGKPPVWTIVFYFVFLIVLINWGKKKKIRWMILLIPIICMGVNFKNGIIITMLDVGQGDGIYIEGPTGKTYFIDGGSSDVNQVGKYRIEPFLCSKGVGELNYVFISHGDSDHYNGIEEMLNHQKLGVRIETLVLPADYSADEALVSLAKTAYRNQTKVMEMRAGQVISEKEMHIHCIQPDSGHELEGNASSMVLDITYNNFEMLCTGDVEGEGEKLLINNLPRKTYDVLKVSHHGSKNSGGVEFLQMIKPKLGLISVGEKNSYGHPHKETLERLKQMKCSVLQTKENGAITLQTNGNALTISTFP